MEVRNRTRRGAMLSVGALWAVILATAMLDCIQFARTASLETYGRLPSLEDVALSHWLSRGETRLLMLQSSVAFLKANNPPD